MTARLNLLLNCAVTYHKSRTLKTDHRGRQPAQAKPQRGELNEALGKVKVRPHRAAA
jgi:hypothetical protein